MVKGKSTCKTLKAIRRQIAEANDIKYEPRECHYEGPCLGTCPACEAEVRYTLGLYPVEYEGHHEQARIDGGRCGVCRYYYRTYGSRQSGRTRRA